MKQPIWTENYRISSYLVNLRGKLGLYALLNLIQDIGFQHAHHLQIRLDKSQTWVFTRQKLEMFHWPDWNETLQIRSWVRSPAAHSRFLLRDYELFVNEQKVGECTSTFGVMNFETRKLVAVDWSTFPHFMSENHLSLLPEKIEIDAEVEDLTTFQVRNSDIDLNHHVNNTKYAQWVLDAIPLRELRAGATLLGYEVNFMAETKPGDEVIVQKTLKDTLEDKALILQFQGIRKSDRKPTFAARLKINEKSHGKGPHSKDPS